MSRNTGNIIKFTLDFIMALTVVLLYESHVINLAFHEIAGICIFGVFLIHCLFNWKWVTGVGAKLFSRSIPARTRFSYWMTILCILLFACIIISGVFISKVLFGQMLSDNRTLGTVFRVMHIFCSALSLIVLGIHVGLYWDFVKRLVGKAIKLPRQAARPVAMVLLAAVCVTGVWSIYSTDFRTWILSPVFGTGQGSHGHGEESEAGETSETGEAGETDATGEAGEENAENASAADGAASSEDSGRS
ncbi:MAG: DUF4405 domain-containing protein, partial [Coriobacteriales bacterium]|nr:DUF4405 domain-containing protein [Coriobacteriales bacterium]